MTAQQIADALLKSDKPIERVTTYKNGDTLTRVGKAKRNAARSGINWDDVLALLTDEQRERIANVG